MVCFQRRRAVRGAPYSGRRGRPWVVRGDPGGRAVSNVVLKDQTEGGDRTRRWQFELLLIVVAYEVYRATRIAVTGSRTTALAHAERVIRIEKWLGIFWEGSVYRALAHYPAVAHVLDFYYGTVHFVVPALALLLLYVWRPARYRRWRNIYGWMLALGLVGFALYPVIPARLLPGSFHIGGSSTAIPPHRNVFAWDADNPYAAMPSLHAAWSAWCSLALWPLARTRLVRALLVAYPLVTAFVVVATANHYLLDVAAGWATLGAAIGLEELRRRRPRLRRRVPSTMSPRATPSGAGG